MNVLFQFENIISQPLTASRVALTPVVAPTVTGSWIAVGDTVTGSTDNSGAIVFPNVVLPNYFKVDFRAWRDTTTFYTYFPTSSVTLDGSSYILSASINNGDPTDVVFQLIDICANAYAVKKVQLQPLAPANVNDGVIAVRDTVTIKTNGAGIVTFPTVVPGTYKVTCVNSQKNNDTIFYINVPAYSGSINATQIITIPTQQQLGGIINVPNGPGGSSGTSVSSSYSSFAQSASWADYALSCSQALSASLSAFAVSASWADVAGQALLSISSSWADVAGQSITSSYSQNSGRANTASYAQNSAFTVTSSYAVAASNADTASWADVSGQSTSASWSDNSGQANSASFSTSSSFSQTSLTAATASYALFSQVQIVTSQSTADSASWASQSLSASYADTINHVITNSVTITDDTNVARLYLVGNPTFGGITGYIEESPSGLNLSAGVGNIGIGNNLQIGIHNITTAGGKFLGTASYADMAASASYTPTSNTSSYALSASNAVTASYAISTSIVSTTSNSYASFASNAGHAATADFATDADFAVSSSVTDEIKVTESGIGLDFPVLFANLGGEYRGVLEDSSSFLYNDGTKTLSVPTMMANNFVGNLLGSASWASSSLSSSAMTPLDLLGNKWYFDGVSWQSPTAYGGAYPALHTLFLLSGPSPSLGLNGEFDIFTTPNSSTPMLKLRDDPSNPFSYNLMEVYVSGSVPPKLWITKDGILHGTASNAQLASSAVSASYALVASTAPLYVLKSGDGMSGNLVMGSGAGLELVTGAFIKFDSGQIIQLANNDLLQISCSTGQVWIGGNWITASLLGTASYASVANTSSFAIQAGHADSASWAPVAGTVQNAVSSSYALTSSYAVKASTADSATTATTASNANTSSWAIHAITASNLDAGTLKTSGNSITGANDIQTFTLHAANTITASVGFQGDGSQITGVVSSSYSTRSGTADTSSYALRTNTNVTVSYASQGLSSSFAGHSNTTDSASYAVYATSTNTNVTVSYANFATSASWISSSATIASASFASQAISSSFSQRAGTSDFAVVSQTENVATQAFATGALDVVMVTGAGNAQQLYVNPDANMTYNVVTKTLIVTASNATSASWAPTGVSPSSSYSDYALSASHALASDTAISSSVSVTSSYAIVAQSAGAVTSASWASASISSSWSDRSNLAMTASYAVNSVLAQSASYYLGQFLVSNGNSQSIDLFNRRLISASGSVTLDWNNLILSASAGPWAVQGSASWATSASWAGNVPQTASYANFAKSSSYTDTASFALNASANSSVSSSWASHSLSASYSDKALTASFAVNVGTIPDTASWAYQAVQAISADFADLAQVALTSSISTIAISASWATMSLSASYAGNVPQTASYANFAKSSSHADEAFTSSYARNAGTADSASHTTGTSDTASYLDAPYGFAGVGGWKTSNITPYAGRIVAGGDPAYPTLPGDIWITSPNGSSSIAIIWADGGAAPGVESAIGLGGSPGLRLFEYAGRAQVGLTSFYASASLSSSWASQSLSASYAGNVPVTSSYALRALSSSYAETSSYAFYQISNEVSASWSSQSFSSSYALKSSNSDVAAFLNGNGIISYSLDFDPTTSLAQVEGRVYYDSVEHLLSAMTDGGVNIQLGGEMVLRVHNKTGVQINNGDVVTGAGTTTGKRPDVKLAIAYQVGQETTVMGLATQDIPNGQDGWVTTFGLVHGLNTNVGGWNEGDILYLSNTTSGSLTNVEPTYPNTPFQVGFLAYKNPAQGIIGVKTDRHDADMAYTSSYAVKASTADSASFASRAITASYALRASNSDSSSWSDSASIANTLPYNAVIIGTNLSNSVASTPFSIDGITTNVAAGAALYIDQFSVVRSVANTTLGDLQAISGSRSTLQAQIDNMASGSGVATASFSQRTISASYALASQTANSSSYATKASTSDSSSYSAYTLSSSFAIKAGTADSASYSTNTLTASYGIRAGSADSASYATVAQLANTATSSSYATKASTSDSSSYSAFGLSSSFASRAISSSFALSAANADSSSFSSYAVQADTALSVSVASSNGNNFWDVTFVKSTANQPVWIDASHGLAYNPNNDILSCSSDIISNTFTASTGIKGNLTGTASWASNVSSASYATNGLSSSYAISASYLNWINQAPLYVNSFSQSFSQSYSQSYSSSVSNSLVVGDSASYLLLHFSGSAGSQLFTDSGSHPASNWFSTLASDGLLSNVNYKFGSSSWRNSGTTSNHAGITCPSNYFQVSASTDFTLESWFNLNSDNYQALYNTSNTGSFAAAPGGFQLLKPTGPASLYLQVGPSLTSQTATNDLPGDNNWHHVALVRQAGAMKVYVDGVATSISITYNGWLSSSFPFQLGVLSGFSSENVSGYIDEFRFSNGIARYTASGFTPPNAEFQVGYDASSSVTNNITQSFTSSFTSSLPYSITTSVYLMTASWAQNLFNPIVPLFGGVYTSSVNDGVLICQPTSSLNVYLSTNTAGKRVTIKNASSGTYPITVRTQTGSIDNQSNYVINTAYASMDTVFDGTNWWLV